MSQEFKFSDPGEGLQEAEVLEVHVSDGDSVSDGDTVLTVETDKANTDIPAPFSGTVDEVKVSEGDMVEIDDVLMTYTEAGESGGTDEGGDSGGEDEDDDGGGEKESSGQSKADESKKEDGDDKARKDKKQDEKSDQGKAGSKEEKSDGRKNEKGQDGSGKRDGSKSSESGQSKKSGSSREPVPAAPSTRRLAREKGVDLHDIEPSGKDGRVTAEDVEAAAGSAEGQKKSRQSQGADEGSPLVPGGGPAPSLPDFSQWGETERTPLRSIRRATARNMALSWGQIPHVYHQDIADITELERFRREHAQAGQARGGKFTLTVLMMKALVSVLKEFPRFNASLDVANQEIVYKHYFHIGLAVATDRGLLVPVIRDVDQKNLVELSAESADIARKTQNGELSRADMMGGSITVTNPGPMGGSSLTPLINHPQVAILGMAQAKLEPVVHGDLDNYEIKPRLRLPLVLGFDHRVNDGADAAQFVTALKDRLADPESLLLNV